MTPEEKLEIEKLIKSTFASKREILAAKEEITPEMVDEAESHYISELDTTHPKVVLDKLSTKVESATFDKEESLEQIESVDRLEPFLGETYKKYIFDVFELYESIINDDNIPNKKETFESKLKDLLDKAKEKKNAYISKQTSDQARLEYGIEEAFFGSDSLNYETVSNLYKTFIEDITVISNDHEGKMYYTIPKDEKIFNEDGSLNTSIKFNFDELRSVYKFATSHGKQVKFHTFLWHNAIPENLKEEINAIQDPNKRKEMVTEFLKFYASELSDAISEFNPVAIEALNEIANDDFFGEGDLRDSWWKDMLGNDYYIDVLKIVKNAFPNSSIMYNEYNEFLPYKNERICNIINHIKEVEKREGITILDSIGLQGHMNDYYKFQQENKEDYYIRQLTEMDIIKSAMNLFDVCNPNDKKGKKIYVTEFDFNRLSKDENLSKELKSCLYDVYKKIASGFIVWGNSDKLSWGNTLNPITKEPLNSHLIDESGVPKEDWEIIKDLFGKSKEQEQKNTPLNQSEEMTIEEFDNEVGSGLYNKDNVGTAEDFFGLDEPVEEPPAIEQADEPTTVTDTEEIDAPEINQKEIEPEAEVETYIPTLPEHKRPPRTLRKGINHNKKESGFLTKEYLIFLIGILITIAYIIIKVR